MFNYLNDVYVENEKKKLDGVIELFSLLKSSIVKLFIKKKRVRKFFSKVLSFIKVVVLFVKEKTLVKEKIKLDFKIKKDEEKKKEVYEVNGVVEKEGSVVGSVILLSIGEDIGSVKNGGIFKKEKEVVCIVCEL